MPRPPSISAASRRCRTPPSTPARRRPASPCMPRTDRCASSRPTTEPATTRATPRWDRACGTWPTGSPRSAAGSTSGPLPAAARRAHSGPKCRWPGVACTSVNRTDRLYALVEELRAVAPRPRSARQLAARYEVSTRKIERDVLALQESGVPIYAVAGRCGGYVIDKTLTLPPLNFTAAEMVAIAVSLARAESTPFASAMRSALRKVLAVASAAQTAEAGQLAERVRLIGG